MKEAIRFVSQCGLESAKSLMRMGSGVCKLNDAEFHTDQLKEIVDAWELVREFGDDVIYLKNHLLKNPEIKEFHLSDWCQTFTRCQLEKAIALVEEVESLGEVS